MNDHVRANRLRRWANRMNWQLCKSRARILHSNDHGRWLLSDDRNTVRAGARFDADLDEVEQVLMAELERLRG